VDAAALEAELGAGYEVQASPGWLLVRAEGPFPGPAGALAATAAVLEAALAAVEVDRYQELRFYVERSLRTTCQALASLGGSCPAT
jgi:hypothetical protein